MEIMEGTGEGATVVHVAGRVNGANAPELALRLVALIEAGCRAIVVDLSHLVHMTSAGFRSLLQADKRAGQAGTAMVVCGLHGLTLELFEVGGFLDMLTVTTSREEAMRRVAEQPA